MANVLYPKFKEFALDMTLGAGGSPATPNVKVALVDSADYTYSAAHQYLSDVPSGGRVALSANLTGKTFSNGIFAAANALFSAVTGDQSEILILYIDTGTPSTSRLVAYLDSGITNDPVTPNGGDIGVTWDASGVFSL